MARSRRLDDVAALAVPSGGGTTYQSTEVRKIDNGYVVRETRTGPEGEYSSSERFTRLPPDLDAKINGAGVEGGGALRTAIESLK